MKQAGDWSNWLKFQMEVVYLLKIYIFFMYTLMCLVLEQWPQDMALLHFVSKSSNTYAVWCSNVSWGILAKLERGSFPVTTLPVSSVAENLAGVLFLRQLFNHVCFCVEIYLFCMVQYISKLLTVVVLWCHCSILSLPMCWYVCLYWFCFDIHIYDT